MWLAREARFPHINSALVMLFPFKAGQFGLNTAPAQILPYIIILGRPGARSSDTNSTINNSELDPSKTSGGGLLLALMNKSA